MSVVDPAITAVSITCLLTVVIVYVINTVDRVMARREIDNNGKKVVP